MADAAPPATRRARLLGLGGGTGVAVLALALVVAAVDRSGWQLDLSADRLHSLDPRLVAILADQRERIELTAIWDRDVHDHVGRPLAEALARMAARNPLIAFRRIDDRLDQPQVAAFIERHPEYNGPGIYVCRGARAHKITLTGSTRLVLQREVGGALLTLAEARLPQAWLLHGHGELRPGGGADDGCSLLVRDLQLGGLEVRALDLDDPRHAGHVPAGVLIVAGPQSALGERGLKAVAEHLRDGGALLLLADDRMPDDLARWLCGRGLAMGPGVPKRLDEDGEPAVLFDPEAARAPARLVASMRNHITAGGGFPYHRIGIDAAGLDGGHAVTRRAAASGQKVLSPDSTRLRALVLDAQTPSDLLDALAKAGTPRYLATPLMQTAAGDAWEKRRADPLSEPRNLAARPPAVLAWAFVHAPAPGSAYADQGARVVVWGSRQAASDGVLAQEQYANAVVLVDAVRWLAGRSPGGDIPESTLRKYQVHAGARTVWTLTALLVAVLPCLAIGIAILAWWGRR